MDAPHCMLCKTPHWSRQPCPLLTAVKASGRPISDLARSLMDKRREVENEAVRTAAHVLPPEVRQERERKKKATIAKQPRNALGIIKKRIKGPEPKKQGWDRAKYNEHMKLLMRERRAKEKAVRDKIKATKGRKRSK